MNYPIEDRVFSVTSRTKTDEGVSSTESLLLQKGRITLQSSKLRFFTGIFGSKYFQDQPKLTLSFETKHK